MSVCHLELDIEGDELNIRRWSVEAEEGDEEEEEEEEGEGEED